MKEGVGKVLDEMRQYIAPTQGSVINCLLLNTQINLLTTDSKGFSKLRKTAVWLFINHIENLPGIDLISCIHHVFGDYTL